MGDIPENQLLGLAELRLSEVLKGPLHSPAWPQSSSSSCCCTLSHAATQGSADEAERLFRAALAAREAAEGTSDQADQDMLQGGAGDLDDWEEGARRRGAGGDLVT